MSKLIRWSQSNPLTVIVIIVIISIFASLKLGNIRIDTSAEGMMMKNDPARDFYNDTLERFNIMTEFDKIQAGSSSLNKKIQRAV